MKAGGFHPRLAARISHAMVIAASVVFLQALALAEDTDRLDRVTLLPHWIPQAQFAGYVMALEKGFFREAGIDLDLRTGGPQFPPFGLLADGTVQFCTEWLSAGILQRVKGPPTVNTAQFFQRSGMMLAARKETGMRSPSDLNGRRIGLWEGGYRIPYLALFRKIRIEPQMIPMYETVNLFLMGAVSAVSVMEYNEYHLLLNAGINPDELTTFKLRDLGLNFPEDGLYCLESLWKDNPGLCRRMVDACLKGWAYACDHPDETVASVMRLANEAHTGTNISQQKWMLARVKELMAPEGNVREMGRLRPVDYESVGASLKEVGLIPELPRYEDFYKGPR